MSVGDLYDVERTGEFAVAKTRVRRRHVTRQAPVEQPNTGPGDRVPITVLTTDAVLADAIHDAAAAAHPVATATTVDEAIELAANGRCGILIESARLKLLDPNPDQIAGDVVPLREGMQGLAAEIGNARLVGPDDPRPLAVPQPGWLRQVPQILQRWQTGLTHLPCHGLSRPRPLA